VISNTVVLVLSSSSTSTDISCVQFTQLAQKSDLGVLIVTVLLGASTRDGQLLHNFQITNVQAIRVLTPKRKRRMRALWIGYKVI
jgi:hypothetical protein